MRKPGFDDRSPAENDVADLCGCDRLALRDESGSGREVPLFEGQFAGGREGARLSLMVFGSCPKCSVEPVASLTKQPSADPEGGEACRCLKRVLGVVHESVVECRAEVRKLGV